MDNSFTINIPDSARHIIDIIRVSNNQNDTPNTAFVVGGCVRDSFLKRQPHDWDICTSALPEQIKNICAQAGYNTYDTGIKHGTVSVLVDKEMYEVTTYRIDGEYKDNRHPDSVEFVDDITKDLSRRDFTINAMAYNHVDGLVDPFHGREDLGQGLIRCVGDPDKRFHEDALRILRAVRFAAKYGFQIEPETEHSIHQNKDLLKNISQERKASEFVQILTYADANLMDRYKYVFAVLVPEIEPMFGFNQNTPWHMYDVWEHTAKAIEAAPKDPIIRLSLFFHDIGKPNTYTEKFGRGHFYGHAEESKKITIEVMKRMKFDNDSIRSVANLVENHDKRISIKRPDIKLMLNAMGEVQLRRLVKVSLADKKSQREPWDKLKDLKPKQLTIESLKNRDRILGLLKMDDAISEVIDSKECYRIKDLAINGKDLIKIGFQENSDIGDALQSLLLDVIEHPDWNNRETLLQKAESYLEKSREEQNMTWIER